MSRVKNNITSVTNLFKVMCTELSLFWIWWCQVFNHDQLVVMHGQTWTELVFKKPNYVCTLPLITFTPVFVKDCCSLITALLLSLMKFLMTHTTFSRSLTHSYSCRFKCTCNVITKGVWSLKQILPRLIIVAAALTPWSEMSVASSVGSKSRKCVWIQY